MSDGAITTKQYIVQQLDTLEGIAARNDSTTGQLMKLNRMSSRLIFPGQTLLVPVAQSLDRTADEVFEAESRAPAASSPVRSHSTVHYPKRFPGHVEPVVRPDSGAVPAAVVPEKESPEEEGDGDDQHYLRRFLKIFVREFTETEGVVSGVLLVTPNCIMFDPDVSHPMVVENGSEKYAMVAPMEAIVSVALFKNASAMTEGTHSPDEVYRTPKEEVNETGPLLSRNGCEEGEEEEAEEGEIKPDKEQSMSSENDPSSDASPAEPQPSGKCAEEEAEKDSEAEAPRSSLPLHMAKPKVFKTLSQGMSCINRASGTILHRAQSVGGSGAAMAARLVTGVPKKFVHMSSTLLGGVSESSSTPPSPSMPGIQYAPGQQQSYATLLDLMRKTAEARQNLDRANASETGKRAACTLPTMEELVPYQPPAGACTQLPYFLHIVLDEHVIKEREETDPDRPVKTEFWFSMPKEMADPFYAFLLRLCPEKYGNEPLTTDRSDSAEPASAGSTGGRRSSFEERSFVVLDRSDAHSLKRSSTSTRSSSLLSSSCALNHEWEIVSLNEIKRRLSLKDIADATYHPLPAGCEESSLLDEPLIRKLIDILPARAQGYPWLLVYSSELHGFALSTMYRQMASLKDDFMSPSLLVIRDTHMHTFGCVVSCRLLLSEHYYGSGESLLFTTHPKFKVYRWTGANTYIVKGSPDSLAIGSGNGVNGLWLDNDFYRGRTERCHTFGNEPLTDTAEFLIAGIEAWCFRLE